MHQTVYEGLPVVKNMPASAGDIRDAGSIPEGGHGNPLQYSCLENPMDRGAYQATVHRVEKRLIQLKWLSIHLPVSDLEVVCSWLGPKSALILLTCLLPGLPLFLPWFLSMSNSFSFFFLSSRPSWKFDVSRCKLAYIRWINRVPLYGTGNSIQYPVINHTGKE